MRLVFPLFQCGGVGCRHSLQAALNAEMPAAVGSPAAAAVL
jgi:hypothetical protein